ncbi:hypothetical protein Q7P37_009118 [Cladosporium fusiforme]
MSYGRSGSKVNGVNNTPISRMPKLKPTPISRPIWSNHNYNTHAHASAPATPNNSQPSTLPSNNDNGGAPPALPGDDDSSRPNGSDHDNDHIVDSNLMRILTPPVSSTKPKPKNFDAQGHMFIGGSSNGNDKKHCRPFGTMNGRRRPATRANPFPTRSVDEANGEDNNSPSALRDDTPIADALAPVPQVDVRITRAAAKRQRDATDNTYNNANSQPVPLVQNYHESKRFRENEEALEASP